MLQRGALELRIALALVLIEHQPANLSLQDWLSSLRQIVRARNNEGKQQPPPPSSSRVQQAGKNGVHVGFEARIGPDEGAGGLYGSYQQSGVSGTAARVTRTEGARTASGKVPERADASETPPLSTRLRLAASTLGPEVIAALEPLLAPLLPALLSSSAPPPLISLPAVTRLLTAIEQSFQPLTTRAGPVAGDSAARDGGMATRFEALGTVAAWLIEQLEVVASSEKGNGPQTRLEGQETGDDQTVRDCTQRLALLLANLATVASRDPTSLRTLINLLTTQLGAPPSSASSSVSRPFLAAAETILPSLVRQLITLLRELVLLDANDEDQNTLRPPPSAAPDANSIAASELWPTTETISILLSLSHLVLDSVSTSDEKLDKATYETMREVVARARADLVRLLGTHGVDVQLAEVPLPFTATTTDAGETAGISIESGVVGLIERLWELQENDEVLAAPAVGVGGGGVA